MNTGLKPCFFKQLHRAPRRRDQAVVLAGAEPEEVETALGGGVVERGEVLRFPRFTKWCVRRRRRRAASAADDSGAEDADVRELFEMRNRDVERLVPPIERPAIARLCRSVSTR